MMRFPNKAKLVELAKFNDFNLLGTGVVIKVQPWSLDHQAIGKIRTTWIKLDKVPDCFKHFFEICEVSLKKSQKFLGMLKFFPIA